MPARTARSAGVTLGTLLAWLAFAAGLMLATKPVWSFWLFGFEPTLDDLLSLRCLSP